MQARATISADYLAQQQELHKNPGYGVASLGYAPVIKQLLDQTGLKTLSDYSAGKCNLRKGLHDLGKRDFEYLPYDPAFPEYGRPKAGQLVCCIDVLEHIEEPYLEAVLLDLKDITRHIGFFSVHTGPAIKTLPDGRNAHIIQKPFGCRGCASISRSGTCNAAKRLLGHRRAETAILTGFAAACWPRASVTCFHYTCRGSDVRRNLKLASKRNRADGAQVQGPGRLNPSKKSMHPAFVARSRAAQPIWFVTPANFAKVTAKLSKSACSFIKAAGFEPRPGRHLVLPSNGGTGGALFGIESEKAAKNAFLPGVLPGVLPAGAYRFANEPHDARLAALAFALGSYRFARYRKAKDKAVRLVLPDGVDGNELSRIAGGVTLARDLINTPANDMGPADLEAAAKTLAREHGAKIRSIVGDDLLKQNFPLVHAVGRAADARRAPRLIELNWGKAGHPKVTLVGKGVCFDTGGLDLKPESAMLIMKKDMGGAATVLALAHMIMGAGLPIALRVLIPAVENSVAGNAFRPLDVYPSRQGLTVEIGNTDAEGRLILADALALACEQRPDLLIDMGTLTGAARVALGPELPPYYTDDETLATDLAHHSAAENDPLWRMPLWMRYDQNIDSKVADVNNVASGGMAGSIICALFLKRFVTSETRWLHFDIYAWTPSARPGRPEGGECQAARAVYAMLKQRYGS